MKKRRRFIPLDKARAAVLGGEVAARGFYSKLPEPAKIKCSRCGEERNSIGQEDGRCLKCQWAKRTKDRQDGGEHGGAI